MGSGFLNQYADHPQCLLFHATHVESGRRAILSNVQTDDQVFYNSLDGMEVVGKDVRLSTAVGISSRFPFLTPPAQICENGGSWGHLVDGGYKDNYGGESMMELYEELKAYGRRKGYNLRFRLLFIENVLLEEEAKVTALYEFTTPLMTFNKVWSERGRFTENDSKIRHLPQEDQALFIKLDRSLEQLIPLGWYLSEKALNLIDAQLKPQTAEAIGKLRLDLQSE
jgi:hypothetical protein